MNKQFILIAFIFPLFLWANQIKEKEADLKTEKVTVFLNGAQITATTNVYLTKGNNSIIFSDLSPNINSNSIQVKGLNKLSVNSIQFDVTYLKQQKVSAELEKLKSKMETLKDEITHI